MSLSMNANSAQARKQVNYAESDAESDDDGEVFQPVSANGTHKRSLKRRKVAALDDSDDDDEFGLDAAEDDLDGAPH